MGEYAKVMGTGERVKIGTCEDLYYLRWDQVGKVWPEDGAPALTSDEARSVYRFRFPFPNEDDVQPGNFDDYDRGITVYGVEVPAIEHGSVQFVASAGYNLCLPCPEGVEGATPGLSTVVNGLTVHRNGFKGAMRVVQQRWWNGELVTVCECGPCGSRYRLGTFDMAAPVIEYFIGEGDKADKRDGAGAGKFFHEMARRIAAGYKVPAFTS